MEKKEFSHEKHEPCEICSEDINTKTEKYSIVIDLNEENIYSIGFYHTSCLGEKIRGENVKKAEKQIQSMQKWAERMLSPFMPKQEVYEV